MKNKLNIAEQLKQKYHKCEEVTNFKEMIERSAQIYKTRTAFKLKNKDGEIYSKTYEEVKNDIYALGTELIENGLTNKRIAVIGKNSYKWAISYLASSIVGVVVPIDKELHSDDVINFMNVAECECILGDGKNLKTITENIEKLNNKKTIFVDFEKSFEHYLEAGRTLLEKENTKFEEIKINPDEMKILLFTSGTTGNAKGVCLSQKNICSNILSIYGIVKVKRSDLFFSILPLHHTYECTIGFLLPLYSGASICYCDGLRYISKNMLEYHPSVILCVPLLLESMYKKIMKSLKKSLPDYMIPAKLVELNSLPLTINGKIDRKKLPDVDFSMSTQKIELAKTSTEKELIKIWKNIFKIEEIGTNFSFFELGGDSLLAIKLLSDIKDIFNVDLNISVIYSNTTIRELGKIIDSSIKNSIKITKQPQKDYYPLSNAQKRIYYASKSSVNPLVYNISGGLLIKSLLKEEKIKQIFNILIKKHIDL